MWLLPLALLEGGGAESLLLIGVATAADDDELLLLLIVPVVYVLCDNPIDTQNAMRAKLEDLKGQRKELQADRDKLLRRMEWIKSDTAYLEMAARDRLQLQKEGEFVLRF